MIDLASTRIARPLALLGAAVTVTLVLVAVVGAAPTLVSPGNNSVVKTTHPMLRWTIPAGERPESIAIASSAATTPETGEFAREAQIELDILDPDETKWTPTRPLPAGKYYWHVSSRQPDNPEHLWSPTWSFKVAPVVAFTLITAKGFSAGHTMLFSVKWRSNVRGTVFTARLYKGNRPVFTRRVDKDNFLIDQPAFDIFSWTAPPTITKGTRLRLVVTAAMKGARSKATATKIVRVP